MVFGSSDDTLSESEAREKWLLLVVSGLFFSLGSYGSDACDFTSVHVCISASILTDSFCFDMYLAFVRAFEDPLPPPMCRCMPMLSDELLGYVHLLLLCLISRFGI